MALAQAQQPALGLVMAQAVVDELWDRMKAIFGAQRWIAEFGPADTTGEWGMALGGLTPAEIDRGVHHCRTVPRQFLPSAAQFRALCRPTEQQVDNVDNATCEYCRRSLPWPSAKSGSRVQGDRIIGVSDGHGKICNACYEKPAEPDWRDAAIRRQAEKVRHV